MKNMSFGAAVKANLCEQTLHPPCCKKSELYGFFLFGKRFSKENISETSKYSFILHRIQNLLFECFHINAEIINQAELCEILISQEQDRQKLLSAFSHRHDEAILSMKNSSFICSGCPAAFIRGAFLSAGTISNPENEYRLEFIVKHLKICIELLELLSENGIIAKFIQRQGKYVLYIKDSTIIEELLVFLGAANSSLEIMNAKVFKDIRNRANRVTNFETANIEKTVEAAEKQLEDIRLVLAKIPHGSIPDELFETAKARLENPEASLKELCNILGGTVSRSGVNHRLLRLIAMAAEIRNELN